LQFDKVEVASGGAQLCPRCRRAIGGQYFAVGGAAICPTCAGELRGPGGRAAFLRALAYGGGAAVLGTIVWFAIMKLTEREFGLLAIGVGLFVGYAVRKGSGGRGGWKYQALAMALTYVSITTSYVPLVIKAAVEQSDKAAEEKGGPSVTAKDAAAASGAPQAPPSAGGLVLGFALILGLAFVSPFLGGGGNIMGLIIIGIALYEAWKINKAIPISGPFQLGGTGSPAIL
jgi:hypothetical protein